MPYLFHLPHFDLIHLASIIPILWGYILVFLGALLESSPFFGLFVPGQSIVILGGFFAKLGHFHLSVVYILAFVGALVGDFIGFILGKKYGYPFICKYGKYCFFKKEYYEKTRELLGNHIGKTVIIGRFNSITRAFVPFVVGTTKTKFWKFLFYDIFGCLFWALVFVGLGFIFGKSYEVASKYIGRIVVLAVILSFLLAYLYHIINKKKHLFAKFHLHTLIINITSLSIFALITNNILKGKWLVHLDIWIHNHIVQLWSPLLNKFMIILTNLVTPLNLIIFSLFLLLALVYKKKWYNAGLLLTTLSGGILIVHILKELTHRARPLDAIVFEPSLSFPSYHAALSTIFFLILLYSFRHNIKNTFLKYAFVFGNIFMFLLIGFSRIYLNVHWFTDVIAGFALGTFWLTLNILIFKLFIYLFEKKVSHRVALKSGVKQLEADESSWQKPLRKSKKSK